MPLKPGLGIGNQNPGPISVSVSEPKLFDPKPKLIYFWFFLKNFQMLSSFSAEMWLQYRPKVSVNLGFGFGIRPKPK